MPTFRYQPIGSLPAGTIEAPDRASAVRLLAGRGITPAAIEPVTRGRPAPSGRDAAAAVRSWRSAMSRAETAMFVRELATAVRAGLPIVTALRTVGRTGRSPRQRAMLAHLIDRVEHGISLGEACREWGTPFTDLIVSLIAAGEQAGRLGEVLQQAADLLDRELKLRRTVQSATIYPAILLSLIVAAIAIVVTVIVPRILAGLAGQAMTLPWPTRVLQQSASLIAGWWWPGALAAVLLFLAGRRLLADPAVRLRVDSLLLRVPLLGRVLRDAAVARFARTLATLTGAGIPVLTALRVTRGTLGNKALEQVIERVGEQVAGGRTIAEPLEQSGQFPPLLAQIVSVGERSGKLPEMLAQAAGALEDRTEVSVRVLTAALPPVLVVLMAGAVGFVILGILLPLLDFQEAVLGQ